MALLHAPAMPPRSPRPWSAAQRITACTTSFAACLLLMSSCWHGPPAFSAQLPHAVVPPPSPLPSPPPPPATAAPPPRNTESMPPPPVLKVPKLLSAGRPAKASVRGNLAPASVVTSSSTNDWLKDRWQAAKDMNGTPFPGQHWVSIELRSRHVATSFVLDWETACADDYAVQALAGSSWVTLSTARASRREFKQHVVDTLSVSDAGVPALEAREFRVLIRRPATRWGVSLWRFEIWGY